jgi:hypothetical protein
MEVGWGGGWRCGMYGNRVRYIDTVLYPHKVSSFSQISQADRETEAVATKGMNFQVVTS